MMQIAQPCLLCETRVLGDSLCEPCRHDLPWMPQSCCPRCALPTPDGAVCGACTKDPPAFDSAHASLVYEAPLSNVLHAYKYRGRVVLGDVLARLVLTNAPRIEADALLPMPVTPLHLRERGFNQAVELARRVAPSLNLPVELGTLRKVRETQAQMSLPWAQRSANVRGAFACDAVANRRFVLLDDVMTTGATAEEASRTLKKAGASTVHVWVLARALRD